MSQYGGCESSTNLRNFHLITSLRVHPVQKRSKMRADDLAPAAYGSQYGYVPGSNAPSVYHTTGSTVARWAAHHYPAPSVVASTAPSERINAHWRWADNVSERMDIAERAQHAQQARRAASHTGHSVYSSSHAPAYFTDARGRLIDIV